MPAVKMAEAAAALAPMTSVEVRHPVPCPRLAQSFSSRTGKWDKDLGAPGDTITTDPGYMRGHGTYLGEEKLIASVAGVVDRVNKLVCVKTLKTRYNGKVSDIVVGRITEVQQKQWKVETNSRLDSVLLLSSMNLPGGELRRRSAEDELAMRDYLQEGDLIGAEVQAVISDGAVSLHTRSNNGFIWIYPILKQKNEETGAFITNLEPVPLPDREVISRLQNCVVALAEQKLMLYDTSILYCYEASLSPEIKDLLKPEVMEKIVLKTRQRLLEVEG
ncbi:exosome complex component RRP4 [Podarcis lilfordi]|uniref:Exosome complex component RRP4 n=1 Tax=Podarcis lilfordi TaxID=74358 RepID=A0AA35KHG0_9SAUR|nr:exosome complex component RRP4 [Podarcis lilfordi]